jgi:S-adenosylmethionine synthetase
MELKTNMTNGEIAKSSSLFWYASHFIEQRLKLRNPIYSETAAYDIITGHPRTVTIYRLGILTKKQ